MSVKARLVGPTGEYELGSGGATIGRNEANSIPIQDQKVSSLHCRIDLESGRFSIADCESRNGTFVNGIPVQRATLDHGDEIRIGHTLFRFFTHPVPNLQPSSRLRLESTIDDAGHTVQLSPAESIFHRQNFADNQHGNARLLQDMNVLLKLSSELNQATDSEMLQQLILERVFEVVPADNGAIIPTSSHNELLVASAVSRRRFREDGEMSVSRSVTQTVLESGKSILRNHLISDAAAADSIIKARVRSVLCVPLSVTDTALGVMYLNTTLSEKEFDERHLQLMTAIAAIAALALQHLRYVEWLEDTNQQLIHETSIRHEMVGQSATMKKVYDDMARLAPGDARVLILGESGTGKELVARAIHNNSARQKGPFVVFNCAAVSESLFASELFGYVKGAFTGAERDRKGFFEEAHGGTLFLDEIGELSLHLQASLLRVIETGQMYRVGSSRPITVDVRLISATNRPLREEANEGCFRADLLFRLGLPLELPPLRERLDDIPLLVRFFLQSHANLAQREIGVTPPETIRVLQEYDWPGNVRELGMTIQWAVAFGKSDRIRPEDLPPYIVNRTPHTNAIHSLDNAKDAYERQLIVRALKETRGVVAQAAELLDRAPTYLQRRISRLGLRNELDRIRREI